MRNRLLSVLLFLCAFVLVACPESCEDSSSPTGFSNVGGPAQVTPSDGNDGGGPSVPSPPSRWSPYMGMHPYSFNEGLQQKYLLPLIESGALRGVRLDFELGVRHGGEDYARWFADNGIEDILAIFPNQYLRGPNAWDVLRTHMSAHPEVKYWELGNEVDLFVGMTPEEYTPIFLDLHAKASREFPDQITMPMPIFGGADAVRFLKKMMDLGLEARARDPEIPLKLLSVHYYGHLGPFLRGVKEQLERVPTVEVWVTETGSEDVGNHIAWVEHEYPRMRNELRATRIYFYNFSGCDEFMLVRGLPAQCRTDPPRFSPLYDALTGGFR